MHYAAYPVEVPAPPLAPDCCGGCGQPDAAPTQWGERLCPKCVAKYAMAYAATDHLEFVLRQAFSAFVSTWAEQPHVIRHMDDEAGVLAQQIMSELLAQRDIAPTACAAD